MDNHTSEQQELISTFCGITGAGANEAGPWLEMMGWDLESAVNMFLEQGGGGAPGSSSGGAAPASDEGPSGDGGVEGDMDEATARAIAEAMGENDAAGAAAADDEVRAADTAFSDRLIGTWGRPTVRIGPAHGAAGLGAGVSSADELAVGLNALLGAGLLPGLGPAPPVGGAPDLGPVMRPEEARKAAAAAGWLFPPPLDINAPGAFDQARQRAKEARRWLVVNVQDVDVFASHELNRDVWADETVRGVLASGFLLWSRDTQHPHGRQFIERYHLDEGALPQVLVVDPRTAGVSDRWANLAAGPDGCAGFLMEFLETHSFESTSKLVRGASPASGGGRKGAQGGGAGAGADVGASAASGVGGAAAGGASGSGGGAEAKGEEAKELGVGSCVAPAGAAAAEEDWPSVPEEPAAGAAGATSVQLRLPDGGKAARRFPAGCPVGVLYAWAREAAAGGGGAGSGAFELMSTFPAKSLEGDRAKTLEEAGLANSAIRMRWC